MMSLPIIDMSRDVRPLGPLSDRGGKDQLIIKNMNFRRESSDCEPGSLANCRFGETFQLWVGENGASEWCNSSNTLTSAGTRVYFYRTYLLGTGEEQCGHAQKSSIAVSRSFCRAGVWN